MTCSFYKVSSKSKVKLIIKEWKDWVKRQLGENMQTGFKQTETWLKQKGKNVVWSTLRQAIAVSEIKSWQESKCSNYYG